MAMQNKMTSLDGTVSDADRRIALRVHGGRLDIAARLYPQAPLPWIDLSTGINPVGYPIPDLSPSVYARLPLAADLDALLKAARRFYGLPTGCAMVAVPGTEIAIRLLPIVTARGERPSKRRVGILGPTYGSHAAGWQASDATVRELDGLPDPSSSDLDVIVVVNPNNPDGRAIAAEELAAFSRLWTSAGRWLIVDEAFVETLPDVSLLQLPMLPPRVVVLRSLGKFFGLAGLRVGFVVVAADEAFRWHDLLGDWPVSGPACEVAAAALQDAAWIVDVRRRLAADRMRLDETLALAALESRGGTDLFGYYQRVGGADLLDHFACRGILIRAFSTQPGLFRFGLPAIEPEWNRLREACTSLAG